MKIFKNHEKTLVFFHGFVILILVSELELVFFKAFSELELASKVDGTQWTAFLHPAIK